MHVEIRPHRTRFLFSKTGSNITQTRPCNIQQYITAVKNNFQIYLFNFFLIFAQKIDCGCTLELPQWGGSNEYPQSMFWSKNPKKTFTPVNPSFTI